MTNTVSIDITATDKAGLDKIAAAYRQQGKAIGETLVKGFREAEEASDRTTRKATENAGKMGTALKGAVSQMSRELDKLERNAALSGEGMSEGYSNALAKLRGDLDMVSKVGERTGRGLDEGLSGALRSVRRGIDELKPAAQSIDKSFETAARSVSRDLYRIEQDAWQAGKGMDKAFQDAMLELRQQLTRARADAARTGADLQSELGGALRNIREEAGKLGESLKSSGGDGGGMIEELLGDFASVKGGALAAGAALGSTLWQGVQSAWAEDRVGGLIAAQTGAASYAAEGLGQTAGRIFYNGFGTSIEEVGEAITAVFQNKLVDTTASEAAIERVTQKVLTLTATTNESSNDIARAARQLFVTGMAGSLTEGLDMIQQATEQGLNTTDELLDTIEEYSNQFQALGLNGQQAFGLIDQAMEGGARNVDIAADALKEFQILAQESTGTAVRGFKALGMDAADSAEKIARGGAGARDVLGEVLNRLRAMPDSVARNSIAVDLFGTKAEDLGGALYSMDLDTATEQFGDLAGAVDAAGNMLTEAQSPLDRLGLKIQNWANTTIGALEDVSDTMHASADEMGLSWSDIFGGSEEAAEGTGKAADKTNEMADAASNAADATSEYVGTLDSLISKQHEYATGAIDLSESQIKSNEAIMKANEVMAEFAGTGLNDTKTAFDLNTEAGGEMQGALNDIVDSTFKTIEAMRQQNATSEEVRGYLESQRTAFYNLATGMGISDQAALDLTNRLFGLPDKVVPIVGINDMASGPLSGITRQIDYIKANSYLRTDVYMYTHAMQGGGGSVRDYQSSYQGGGGRESGGISFSAATGGARHSSTTVNEAGPEAVQLPDGSKVMTAGATRAMGEAGLLQVGDGGGAGRPTTINLVLDGRVLASVMIDPLRDEILRRGGVVQQVLARG